MLKLSDNPAPLLEGLNRPGDAHGDWFVLHTKPRAEKMLAWDLTALKVPYYLPMARRTQMSGGRKRTVLLPLFPSYVFVAGGPEMRLKALSTRRVCHTLPVPQRVTFVSELESIYLALTANGELDVYPHVAVGKRCRVMRGPLRGVEGVVVQDDDVTRIVLQVSMIGRGAALEISADDLEAAE